MLMLFINHVNSANDPGKLIYPLQSPLIVSGVYVSQSVGFINGCISFSLFFYHRIVSLFSTCVRDIYFHSLVSLIVTGFHFNTVVRSVNIYTLFADNLVYFLVVVESESRRIPHNDQMLLFEW